MKILLINPPIRINSQPSNFPFGQGYLAAVLLKAHHEVRVLDINGYRYGEKRVEELLRKYLIDEDINIVGIGSLITCYKYVKWLNNLIKKIKPEAKIIIGGGIGTSIPKIALEKLRADIVVVGEGEETIVELMDYFNKKRKIESIKGIYYWKNKKIKSTKLRERIKNLDELPLPAWELFPMQIYLKNAMNEVPDIKKIGNGIDIVTGRGCPYHCTYCYDPLGHSRTIRSVEKVVEELSILKKRYGVSYFFFTDPCFVMDKQWVHELCDAIIKKRLNIKWASSARVNLVDEKVLRKMKEAGCLALNYGIESGSQRMLDIMKKGVTVEQASKAIKMTREAGIKDWLSFIIGFPEETEEDIEETAKFCIKNDVHLVSLFFATAYPGTELYEQVKRKGMIKDEEDYISRLGDATEMILNLTQFSDEKLIRLRDRAITKVRIAYFKRHRIEQIKWYFKKAGWAFSFIRERGILAFLKRIKNYF